MTVSITEHDGTKRTMQGHIYNLDINVDQKTLVMKVIGITKDFTFEIKGNVTVSESEVL